MSRLLDFEVEACLQLFFVSLAVKAIETSGAVGDVLFDFVGFFEDFEFQELFAEVALVEWGVENAFVEALQLGEGEFTGEEFEADGRVPKLGADALLGGGKDFGMVESKVWKVVEREPGGLISVSGCGGRVFVEINECVVRDGDDVFARVALGLTEGIELF